MERPRTTLVFVSGIPRDCNENALKEHFNDIGEVLNVEFKLNREGQRKGCAILKFETPKIAESALSKHESILGGRHIDVELARSRSDFLEMRRRRNGRYSSRNEGPDNEEDREDRKKEEKKHKHHKHHRSHRHHRHHHRRHSKDESSDSDSLPDSSSSSSSSDSPESEYSSSSSDDSRRHRKHRSHHRRHQHHHKHRKDGNSRREKERQEPRFESRSESESGYSE